MGGDIRYREEFDRTGSGSTAGDLQYFKGWNPGEHPPLTQPQGIDVRTIGSSKIDLLYGLHPTEIRGPVTTDRPVDNPVRGGVLELRFDDPDFDRKLQSGDRFDTLKITGIQPEKLHHWVDNNGYFLWFEDSTGSAPKRHYYPASLKTIEVDGLRQDVDMQRIKVSDAYMAKLTGAQQGFDSMDRRTDVLTYFKRMSGLSSDALALEERILRDGSRNSTNPYFRIYLADVLTTQAMQPIIGDVTGGGQINAQNPETIRKLDEAIDMLRQAEKLSYDQLSRGNQYPPGNVSMPLAPYLFYSNPYGFWGGSLYQAQRREVALTFIRGLIQSGALRGIELPPALPPR